MATRKSTEAEESEVPGRLPELTDPEETALQAAMRENEMLGLSDLVQQLAGVSGSSVTVYRADRNKPLQYLFQCQPENFSLDDLRDRYGGGEFRLYVMRDGKLWKNRAVTVERSAVPAPASQAGAPDSGLAAVAAALKEQSAMLAGVIQALRAPQPASNPTEMLTAVVAAFSALKQAVPPPYVPAAPVVDTGSRSIDLILKGVELARELGGGGGESSPLDLLRDLIRSPMLAEAVRQSIPGAAGPPVAARLPKPPARPAQPAGGPVIQPQMAPVQQPTAGETTSYTPTEREHVLRSYLAGLAELADQGVVADEGADMVLDYTPPAVLEEWLGRDDVLDVLSQVEPRLAMHRPWCSQVLELVRLELTPEPESGKEAGIDPSLTDVSERSERPGLERPPT